MPSELFFLIDFSLIIFVLIIGLILSFITILIVVKNRTLRTFDNILLCNTSIAVTYYSIVTIIASILGFHKDWAFNAPLCSFRAFCSSISIAVICYSKSIHAISHLFFAIFYNRRYLLTWRVHRILIILSWVIGIMVCVPPLFVENGYGLEKESRSCIISSRISSVAFYMAISTYTIPLILIGIIHLKILYYVHQSTRRIRTLVSTSRHTRITTEKNKREIKLIRQMFRQTGTLTLGGLPYLIVIIWHASREESPLECLYLLSSNFLTISIILANIIQFITNKKVKETVLQNVFKRRVPIKRIHQQHQRVQPWYIT